MDPYPLDHYPHTKELQTRWMDNDIYGHVNNVVYYSYFDTVVNSYLIENKGLDIHESPIIGLVIETQCTYLAPIEFPMDITAGLKVSHLGNSSVRYEIGLFTKDPLKPVAQGYFVHVYVDRNTRKPTPIPDTLRQILKPLVKRSL
ncbi:thioesterase family protein [Temperatibacter marinus]|uniref:Thioesterase family protein n=1 Tax=Temperatibacter marinus TaxID=1456591 RepID=A0AA52HAF0_9PROT|nr:thioesterase family protein [Temperatibacter marinus]WND03894.1 thioesterase family protein [Temperatibacter marinus]